jgi:hypothetical protein
MTAVEVLERDVAREERGKKPGAVRTVKARSKLQLKEAGALGLAKDNRMEGAIPEVIGPGVEGAELVDQPDGRKRRRAPIIDYKQLAGIETRRKRTKEEIMREKVEKEARLSDRAEPRKSGVFVWKSTKGGRI